MSLTNPTRQEFRDVEERIVELEQQFETLRKHRENLTLLTTKLMTAAERGMLNYRIELAIQGLERITDTIYELEAFLIENEAPGWTST